MNDDLIDNLAKKAGAGVCCYDDIDLETFAELIIQECVDTIMNDTDRHRKEYFAGLLKEHFGVE